MRSWYFTSTRNSAGVCGLPIATDTVFGHSSFISSTINTSARSSGSEARLGGTGASSRCASDSGNEIGCPALLPKPSLPSDRVLQTLAERDP